jgi:hypothetical protein
MSETKAPAVETKQRTAGNAQDTEKQAAQKETANQNAGEQTSNDAKHNAQEETNFTADETGNSRQRFFSQTDVNRIVKREVERAIKSSKLPELEAAQVKVTELESRLKHKELREQVTEAAARAGAKNATLIFHAVEEKVELNEKGKPKNLDEVLKNARRDFPELFRRDTNGNANGGAGQNINSQLSMNELLRKSR